MRIGRARTGVVAVTCARCQTDHRPRLTAGACPVCGEVSADLAPGALPRALDRDTRVVSMIAATMALNLLLLAVLAVAYL